jgi:hypothetical protein
MDKAKKRVIEDGYVFAKGKSRSKFEELESPVKKEQKYHPRKEPVKLNVCKKILKF